MIDGTWWEQWPQATCMPLNCFCEGAGAHFIRQPINTISNAGFYLVAFLIWQRSAKPQTNRSIILSFTLLFMGITSTLYHAGLTFFGQWIDNLSMYLICSYAFAIGVHYSMKKNPSSSSQPRRIFNLLVVIPTAIFGHLSYIAPDWRRQIFGVAMVSAAVGLGNARLKGLKGNRGLLALSLASFMIALTFWTLDNSGTWCNPDWWINGHALWHLGSALSCWFFFLYLKSCNLLDD